ncbi:MAG: sulfotransferase [Bacteroidetes bacterium]|nr:sulfotransferase [Bacteroidota bacterium]
MKPGTPFFFIIGRPRSGTTLLRFLFEAHPNVLVPPECPVILSLYKKYQKRKFWKANDIEELVQDILKQRYFETWLITEDRLRERLMECQGANDFWSILETLYLSYQSVFPKEDIRLIGDKNPAYSLYIKRIQQLYPGSKFIYINRDYRDNYLSLIRVNFEVPVVPLVVYRWKFAYRQFRKLQKQNPGRFYYLRYEDLVEDAQEHFARLCSFLDIPYNEEVFDFHRKKQELESAYGNSDELKYIHQSLLNPISAKNIGSWKEKMTEKEIRKADLVAGKAAEEAGYRRQVTSHNFWLAIKLFPLLSYARMMYALMLWGEKLPYGIRNALLELLSIFLKTYWWLNKKKFRKV